MIGFWYVFFSTDCTILDKLFELRPFTQTGIPPDKILLSRLLLGFWYIFFYTDYTISDSLFELRPIIQRVIPHDKILLCRFGLL